MSLRFHNAYYLVLRLKYCLLPSLGAHCGCPNINKPKQLNTSRYMVPIIISHFSLKSNVLIEQEFLKVTKFIFSS